MKIQLDTTNKNIKIEESVNLGEFVEVLDKLLPGEEWKKFTLETVTVINNWRAPIIVNPYTPRPYTPTWPWITYDSTSPHKGYPGTVTSYNKGTYCLEVESKTAHLQV